MNTSCRLPWLARLLPLLLIALLLSGLGPRVTGAQVQTVQAARSAAVAQDVGDTSGGCGAVHFTITIYLYFHGAPNKFFFTPMIANLHSKLTIWVPRQANIQDGYKLVLVFCGNTFTIQLYGPGGQPIFNWTKPIIISRPGGPFSFLMFSKRGWMQVSHGQIFGPGFFSFQTRNGRGN